MCNSPIIEFQKFSFKYYAQSKPTLKSINLKIYKGEKILIIGPSGSGKSTLGNCLNGLIPHSYVGKIEGALNVAGMNPSHVKIAELSKTIGTVLQDTDGQFVGLSVAEDLVFALENDRVPTPELKIRADEIAELVGLTQVKNNSPQEISGGQKQRTSIGGILIDDVEIILFDEPLANLDPATGKKAIELIDEIHINSKKTVLIIEHRVEDVLHRKVDRIVLMHEGKIIADMPPHEIIASNLFSQYGIREPLYITLLKYAGVDIFPEMAPAYIESIALKPYAKQVLSWYSQSNLQNAPSEIEEVLHIHDLHFSYISRAILKNISVRILKGEMLAIVGRNGAGKSTLSKLICGFEKNYSGKILLNGKNVENLSIAERATIVGYVMQNPNHMITEHKIYDEIALGLRLRGFSEEEIATKVQETTQTCGLERFLEWPVSALSYGQKKRVTIASILILEPKILILDEPTAGQDYYHYTEIMEFIKKLNKEQGITIILITHDMHLMMEYTKRSVVLNEGCIIADTDSSEVLTNENIVKQGSLKETSIFHVAKKMGIGNPKSMVDRFIDHETRLRVKK